MHHRLVCMLVLAAACLITAGPLSAADKRPDVVYVPTPHDVVAKMLKLAKVTKKDVVYDLGCGDGRIVVTAARTIGCRCVGVEIDPDRPAVLARREMEARFAPGEESVAR